MSDLKTFATDKRFLQSIVLHNYELPANIDPYSFACELLPNLGSPDGELRDELSSMILANSIIAQQRLTPAQLQSLLCTVLDQDHLFYHITEVGTNAVFMRSFSNLAIAAILYSDGEKQSLPAEMVKQTRKELLRYAREERDWRGYIDGKGWAHAMAHLASALDECAQNRALNEKERVEILETVGKLACQRVPLYHEEDVRLAMVVYHMILGRQINEGFLKDWLKRCIVSREADGASWIQGTNTKNFLRSLYFLLHWEGMAPVLAEYISGLLKKEDAVYTDDHR